VRPDRRSQPAGRPLADRHPAGPAGHRVRRDLRLHSLSWNEFIYALTLVTASSERTIPVGVLVQLTRADFYYFWGPLMAGALAGSIPVALIYSFFVDQYAAGLPAGAVKG
jgi:ABC-type maltose transport system permease subunit